ncbi:hypothetical protein EBT16_03860, partial [bacterium]|nr:hypothetical protein [bacterium]
EKKKIKSPPKQVGKEKKPVKESKKAVPVKKETKPGSAPSSKKPAPAKKESAPLKTAAPKRLPLGPIEPGRLGQKRNCLKCETKFYDFERMPITCPKCFSEFEPSDFEPKISLKSEGKKARPVEKEEEPERELVVSDSGDDFESLEDLNDDDSAVVGIGPDKDSDESFD